MVADKPLPNAWNPHRWTKSRDSYRRIASQSCRRKLNDLAGAQSTPLLGVPPPSIKHPQDNFNLQNEKGLATSNLQVFFLNHRNRFPLPSLRFGGCQFAFRRVSICILEVEIVLGVLYTKGGPPKGGYFGFPPRITCVRWRSYLSSKHRHWSLVTLPSLRCDSNRAISVHVCSIRSTWHCGMACEN